MRPFTRRLFLSSLVSLPGCATLGALNDAATPLDTFALQPVAVARSGARVSGTLLVVEPAAPAPLTSDRILIKPDALSVTYLPGARWSDDLPRMIASVLVQSLSAMDQIGYVGTQGDGPIPDVALLTRIDRFGVAVQPSGAMQVEIDLHMTLLRDRDQRIIASRRFTSADIINSDTAPAIVRAFQARLDTILPDIGSWVRANL